MSDDDLNLASYVCAAWSPMGFLPTIDQRLDYVLSKMNWVKIIFFFELSNDSISNDCNEILKDGHGKNT
jgi:Golgi nucleoside diphosphatase